MAEGETKRPNILLLMPDQHRFDVISAHNKKSAVRTPNLDRLSHEGISFTSAFCNGPLCMPARASLLSERYVRDHGVFENTSELKLGSPTFVRSLADAGYHTACIGKMHLWVHGPARKGGKLADTRAKEAVEKIHAYGFKETIETTGKLATVAIDSEYSDYLQSHDLLKPYRKFVNQRNYGGPRPVWSTDPVPMAAEHYIDAWHGRRIEKWILDYEKEEPFFLWAGFPGPHDPWDAPKEAVDRYNNIDIDLPESLVRPEFGKGGPAMDTFLKMWHNHSNADGLTDDVILAVRRAYYANISIIDDAVGRIMRALEKSGRLDNTFVIYCSDHGEMMGEHRLLMKMVFYDQSVKVPLIIRPPSTIKNVVRGRVVEALVDQLDLSRTITDVAGVSPVPGGEGNSLSGVFQDGGLVGRSFVVAQNYGFTMFRTSTHKVVVEEDTLIPGQFFDLVVDPHEDRNIVADPTAKQALDQMMALATAFLRGSQTTLRPHRPTYQKIMKSKL